MKIENYRGEKVYTHDLIFTQKWDDAQVSVSGVRLPASGAPSFTDYKSSQLLAFSKTATNTIHFNVQLPHSYQIGSDIEFHIHLAYPDNGAGTVDWQLTHSWASINGTFPNASVVPKTVNSPTTADYHQIVDFGTISGTGKGISSILLCSLARIGGTDTYDNVVYLVGIDFHIQKDTTGSTGETSK